MDYISITPAQKTSMLEAIGAETIDELFSPIPESCRFTGDLDLPPALAELDLQRELQKLAAENSAAANGACFIGAGAYDHFVPVFIDQFISRGEFLTAYTPYQAEASQGSLQAFFEFQTQVARLTGMDISNASLYEGASAVGEAAMLALNATGKRRVLVASTIHPDARATLKTQLEDLPAEFVLLPAGEDGRISPAVIAEHTDSDTACVIIASPNIYGLIEDWKTAFHAFQNAAGDVGNKPLNIAVFNPTACALLKNPGDCGADVAVGEGQPLGVPLQFGGPYLGLFAAKQKFLRKMPGRLVGQTSDGEGRRAFCLILQTREQHIRGARATSNICTNQGLLALRATMYMTALGPQGLRDVAEQSWHKAHYLAKRIAALPGYDLAFDGEFFNEFLVRCPVPASAIIDAGRAKSIHPGVDLSCEKVASIGAENQLLIAVTEKRTRAELDALVDLLVECAP